MSNDFTSYYDEEYDENDDEEKKDENGRGNPSMKSVSHTALLNRLETLGIVLPNDTNRDILLHKCAQIGCLTDEQWIQAMPQFKVLKCYLHTYVENQKLLQHIDRIVLLASKFWALGSRLLNAWIMECYERDVNNQSHFKSTLDNQIFLRHILRCGRIVKGKINDSLAESNSLRLCQTIAPTIDEMTELLPLAAWGQIFNSLQKTYSASFKEHVTRHMKTRIQSHLKRLIHMCQTVKLKKRNYKTMVMDFHGHAEFPLSLVYENIGKETFDEDLPEEIKEELETMRTIVGGNWKSLLTAKNIPFCKQTFDLHLYLRSKVPMMEEREDADKEDNVFESEPMKIQVDTLEEEKDDAEIKYAFKGKGFSPAPTTKLGRIHVTIDKKVLQGLIEIGVVVEGTSLEDVFGVSNFKTKKKQLRKILRKKKKNKGGTKKQRASVRKNGVGRLPEGKVSSILTDGVDLCIRFICLNKDLHERLLRWDGEGKLNQRKIMTQKDWTEYAQKKYEELIKVGYVRLIAIDPGREELFHSATIVDGSCIYEEHRFKRSKYVEVSLRNKMTDFVKHRKTKEICDIEGILAKNGGWKARTSGDYEKVFESWVTESRALQMIDHYCHIGHAIWKMRLYRRRESVLYQRYKRMIGDRYMYVNGRKVKVGVMVGYGSANIGQSGKGEVPVPTARNAMLLRKYLALLGIPHAVIMVWEHLTSQMCHACQKRMVSFLKDKIPIRGLKLCKSTECSKDHNPAFRNRDGNAARNLVTCLEAMVKGQNRPTYLCPQPPKGKTKKTKNLVAP